MEPVDFEEANMELTKPEDMTDEQCSSLPVFHDGKVFISKWKLDEEEKKHVAHHGYIYVMTVGTRPPPVAPIAKSKIFDKPEKIIKSEG